MKIRMLAIACLGLTLSVSGITHAPALAHANVHLAAPGDLGVDDGSSPSFPPEGGDEESSEQSDGSEQAPQDSPQNEPIAPPAPVPAPQAPIAPPAAPVQPVRPEQSSQQGQGGQGNPVYPAPGGQGGQNPPESPSDQQGQQTGQGGELGQVLPPGHPGFTIPGEPAPAAPDNGTQRVGGVFNSGPGDQQPSNPGQQGRAAGFMPLPAGSDGSLFGIIVAGAAIAVSLVTAARIQRIARSGQSYGSQAV